jgi:ubiquinone/menaquinone biosynthesis C-methylase UbiE
VTDRTPSSADRTRALYRHLGAAGLASRTKPEWDAAIVDAVVALLPPSGDVLDVGCGYGRIAIPLARRGYRVTGLDLSRTLLRAARRDARAANLVIRFDEGSMTALPYPDAAFDACVCLWSAFNELLEPSEQVQALAEMRRVLRPGGPGIVEGPVPEPATRDDPVGTSRIASDTILGRTQLRYVHDETTLTNAARAAGLSEIRVDVRRWAGRERQILRFRA